MNLVGLNIEVSWAIPSEGYGEESIPCLFQLLEAMYILWLLASSFVFKTSNG